MNAPAGLVRRHQLAGWWGLVAFASLGIALEVMHGFKLGWYLDLANETRRHLFTLAHAHGTVLSLVNLAFAASPVAVRGHEGGASTASACLLAAAILLPGGFFLGGLAPESGDPGIGIVAVPIGAAALVVGAAITAWSILRNGDPAR
jgi:hypothetical protein